MQLNPARGRKHLSLGKAPKEEDELVYAAQPREGTETSARRSIASTGFLAGLCSSTPRGDGNSERVPVASSRRTESVYAAQPREGTETPTY